MKKRIVLYTFSSIFIVACNQQTNSSVTVTDSAKIKTDSFTHQGVLFFDWKIKPKYCESAMDSIYSDINLVIQRGNKTETIKIDSIQKINDNMYQMSFLSPLNTADGSSHYIRVSGKMVLCATGFYAGHGDELFLVNVSDERYILKWAKVGEEIDKPEVVDIKEIIVPKDENKPIKIKSLNL